MKPMLACEVPLEKIRFPVYVSVKLDGIRCLAIDGVAYSRSLKAIRNKFIQKYFSENKLDGLDGELIVGNNFQDSTSGVMSTYGEPDFTYHIFDFWNFNVPYNIRYEYLAEKYWPARINILRQIKCLTQDDVQDVYDIALVRGYEGIIVRSTNAPYKQGRSTPIEQYLVKMKPTQDDEAIIIGFEEQMENTNEQKINLLGLSERSSAKDGMVGKNTLGAFVVKHADFGEFTIGCGQGLTQFLRQYIWDNKSRYLGRLVKFKYQSFGVKDKPRFPIFLGFRDVEDL